LTKAVGDFAKNHEQDTRELIDRPARIRYQTNWSGRSDVRDHYFEREFAKRPGPGPRETVRVRAFRKPRQELDLLLDAALREAGSSAAEAPAVPDLASRSFSVTGTEKHTIVMVDDVRDLVVVLECGRARCGTLDETVALATTMSERFADAAGDRRKLAMLLGEGEMPGWNEVPLDRPARNPFDRVRLEATVQGGDHSVEVEVWREPDEGVPARLAAARAEHGLSPDESVSENGGYANVDDAFHFVFAVPATDTVVRMRCRTGLCPSRDEALAIARRMAQKAEDISNFVLPDAERPRPFVPRGNVKGRAERIWLPFERFWLKIE
jgi:hypothetical protein